MSSNIGEARVRRVEYVQWWGDNLPEVKHFIGAENVDHLDEKKGKLIFFPVGIDEPKSDSCDPYFEIDAKTNRPMAEIMHERWVESCTLNIMDYIVRKGRRMFVMRKDDFEDQYEFIQEPEMN